MELMETPCTVMPSESQRAFVIAMSSVGLPWRVIADALPSGPLKGADLSQAEFERYFNEDRKRGPLYAVRLIVGRVLWRAMVFDDRAGVAASLAVFKSLKDWTHLKEPVESEMVELHLHRLTRRERDVFRRLYHKAVGRSTDGRRRSAALRRSRTRIARRGDGMPPYGSKGFGASLARGGQMRKHDDPEGDYEYEDWIAQAATNMFARGAFIS